MPTISIVIPTMNRLDSLQRTISNIMKGTMLPTEIVVVDQTPDIGMKEAIKTFLSKTTLKCIYIHQNIPSLTKARNTGMNYVSGDIVIQMDDDVDIHANTLETINNIFNDNNIAMLAGIDEKTTGKSRSLLGYLFWKKSWIKRNIGHVTLSIYGRFPITVSERTPTEWCMGFFAVFRTNLIRKWNLKWDEKLTSYAYAEDLDFSFSYYKKAKREGLSCIMSNTVLVKHNVSREWRIPLRKHTYMIIRNRAYLSQKHFKKSILARIALIWSNWGELFRRIITNEAPKDWWDAMNNKPL